MPPYKAFEGVAHYPLGDCDLFSGDHKTAGGLVHVGMLEGDISESQPYKVEHSTADQYTGDAPHFATARPGMFELNFSVIGGQAGIMAKLGCTGSAHIGGLRRKKVTETSAWLVPRALFDAFPAGFNYDGAAWNPVGVPSDPNMENTAFYPRCYFRINSVARGFGNAGHGVVPVTLVAMVDMTAPSGAKDCNIVCRGNPVAFYPAFRL